MTVLREQVETTKPLEAVFGFVGDFANAKAWDPGVAEAERVTAGPIGVGTRYELRVVFGSRTLPMTYEVTEWDPPHRVVLRGEGSTVTAVDDIRFESTSTGTLVRYSADLRLKGVLGLAEPLFKRRFERTALDAMAGMRAALDALPD